MINYLNLIDKELQSKKIDEQGYLGKIKRKTVIVLCHL